MGTYILAHDLGTSGNKATLYCGDGTLAASCVKSYRTITPKNGYMEQDPAEWWEAVCRSTKELMQAGNVTKQEIGCITFSGQMMGCVPVDKNGAHLYNALIWADTRYEKQMSGVEQNISMQEAYQITGHRLSASYSAAKLKWLQENIPSVYENTYKMLQAKDYIICRLTGRFATDYSDAAGTNLLNLVEKKWSETMISAYGMDGNKLPDIYDSTEIIGGVTAEAAKSAGLLAGTPVVMGGGDGSCAAAGAGVIEEGNMYHVLGSSSWISNAAKAPVYDDKMRTFNWIALDKELYNPCGTMQAAGYSFHWATETLCDYEKELAEKEGKNLKSYLNEQIEMRPAGADNLLYLPYLLGERSPRWNLNARAAFIGLGAAHTKADMLRAVMEGVGYNLNVILKVIQQDCPTKEIILIGGGAKSLVWAQILSDIWQKKIVIPRYYEEATSLGAAVCGGIGIGMFADFSVIKAYNPMEREILPNEKNREKYEKLYELFNDSYEALDGIYNRLSEI